MNPLHSYLRVIASRSIDRPYLLRAGGWLLKFVVTSAWRFVERWTRRARPEPCRLPHPPIFILGYYRSGTTHLQQLLLVDPQFGYIDYYQSMFSEAFSLGRSWMEPLLQWLITRLGIIHLAHRVPLTFALPGEDDVALLFGAVPESANWGHMFPRRFRELYGRSAIGDEMTAELQSALADLHWRVSVQQGHRQLVLKSPPHTSRVGALLRLYPDAKFIFIHRDPIAVFGSNKRLWEGVSETWFQRIDEEAIQENILWSYELAHRYYERDKVLLAPGQLVEVCFRELKRQPVETLANIYTTLGLQGFDDAQTRLRAYVERVHDRSETRYALSPAEARAVDERLGPWCDLWGYGRPTGRSTAQMSAS